jgi:dephospho-CoA kinase
VAAARLSGDRLRVGLTGGIGSGKSTVARLLANRGALVVDTDAIARRLTQPGGAAIPALREAFGVAMIRPDGGLDREQMRQLVFADANLRRRLESILHPMISDEALREAAAASGAPVVVFDVPLLVESGRWRDLVHRIVVVDCSEPTQIARVRRRSGWTAEAVKAVIEAQATREQRRLQADDVLVNDGIDEAELERRVGALWDSWKALGPPAV